MAVSYNVERSYLRVPRSGAVCAPGSTSSIIDLRKILAERFGSAISAPRGEIVTGISVLDEAGALRNGSITEFISSRPGAGAALLIHQLLERARQERFFVALVDGADSFDPQSAGATALQHLLWVRCGKASEGIKAADLLLRDGNFPIVILDLVLNSAEELRRIPATSWYRLQRLVEVTPTAFLVMSRHNMVASARTKILLENQWKLSDLERDDAPSQIQIRIRRSPSALPATG